MFQKGYVPLNAPAVCFRLTLLAAFFASLQTIAVTQNFVSCRLEKNFESPEKFIPERWLKGAVNKTKSTVNPYLVLPFGHGMRACIARRFAEQNMLVLLIRVNLSKQYEPIRLLYSFKKKGVFFV